MIFLYNLLFPLLFLLYIPYYIVHLCRRGGLTADYWQRFGIFSGEIKARLKGLKEPVWIHSVSVGETVAAITFIHAWQKRWPSQDIVLSCSTSTAHAMAEKKLPSNVVLIYCPIDFWWAVRHALNLIRPRALVIFEVEIWPNLILQAAKRGAKVFLVNGRMSDSSSRGYAKWSFVFRPIFQAFQALCVQTQEDASRIARVLGDDAKIHVCGTMKFDQVPDVDNADKTAVLDACFGSGPRTVLTAGSTHPGEEELVCDAYLTLKKEFTDLRLVLVPRHCERAAEVENLLKERNLSWRLLKAPEGSPASAAPVDVLLVNTTGELMNFYGASDIAYVGKSLAGQTGGHNIIEPAIFGKAIIHGSHMENFREVATLFRKHNATVEVPDEASFQSALRRLLEAKEERESMGQRAREVVDRCRGAIDRTFDRIGPFIDK